MRASATPIAALLAAIAAPLPAVAYCIHNMPANLPAGANYSCSKVQAFDRSRSWGDRIQIYVSTDGSEALESSFSGLSTQDVENYIAAAAANWFDDGQAEIRFSGSILPYNNSSANFMNDPSVAGGVLIAKDPCYCGAGDNPCYCTSSNALSCTSLWTDSSACYADRAIIWFVSGSCVANGQSAPWAWTIDPSPGQNDVLRSLEHEMGHALTLDHPVNCSQPYVHATMNIGTNALWAPPGSADGRFPYYDDIEGLLALYGYRTWQAYYSSAADNGSQSWAPATENSYVGNDPDVPFANAASSQNLFYAFPDVASPYDEDLDSSFLNPPSSLYLPVCTSTCVATKYGSSAEFVGEPGGLG